MLVLLYMGIVAVPSITSYDGGISVLIIKKILEIAWVKIMIQVTPVA